MVFPHLKRSIPPLRAVAIITSYNAMFVFIMRSYYLSPLLLMADNPLPNPDKSFLKNALSILRGGERQIESRRQQEGVVKKKKLL